MNEITRTPLRVRHPTRMRLVQVLRAEVLSPRMRRIVFGGEELDGFTSLAADDHVKLLFPEPGQAKPTLPVANAVTETTARDGKARGDAGNNSAGDSARRVGVMRDYTPRRFDAAARELTIDFVLHGDGPATSWTAQARPGQWLGVGGPRGSFLVPDDFDAYLLIGDETALPAIGRALEEMRPGTQAIALIEVASAEEEQYLPTTADAAIRWLHRNGKPAGTGLLLRDALQALRLPPGDVHAWLAGEIDVIRGLRTHLIEQRGLPRSQIRAAGYWRIGAADGHARLED